MGADSCPAVCCFDACTGHVPTLCLRCIRSFVSVAWRSSSVAFLLVPLPPSRWFFLRLGGLFILLRLGFWPQCDVCHSGGLGARGLVAGLRVGRPVGVLPLWSAIAVTAPWPKGTQPSLATRTLNRGNRHGITNLKIELNNTVNKTQIEIDYSVRDKLATKTVKQNNGQRDDWQHGVFLSAFNRLFNPCSMTQGRRVSIVNSCYFKADESFQMTIDVTCLES